MDNQSAQNPRKFEPHGNYQPYGIYMYQTFSCHKFSSYQMQYCKHVQAVQHMNKQTFALQVMLYIQCNAHLL